MARNSVRHISLKALIVSLVVSGALGIIALLANDFGNTQVKVLLTSLTVSAASILALASATALERKNFELLARAGIGFTCATAVMILISIWVPGITDEYMRSVGSVGTVAIALAHSSLLSLAALAPRYLIVRRAAFALAGLLAAMLIFLYWSEIDEDWYARALGIVSICLTVATILTPILHRMSIADLRVTRAVPGKVNLGDVYAGITSHWSPVEIAKLDSDHVVRAARVLGVLDRHVHDDQDEFFLVQSGELTIRFDDDAVTLSPGEGLLVPAGVQHQPEASEETHILLFEPSSTRPRGNTRN